MKKTVIFSMMLAIGAGYHPLHATGTPEALKAEYFSVFPGKYTKDGKSILYTYGREDDVINRFYVYDEDLQLIKEFEPVKGYETEIKEYRQERMYGYEIITPVGLDSWDTPLEINGQSDGLSIDRVCNYLMAMYGQAEISSLSDGTPIVVREYFDYYIYGQAYPSTYWKEVNGKWYEFYQRYEESGAYGPFGEWGDIDGWSDQYKSEVESIYLYPDSGGDSESYRLTKGIFGDDCHYVMPLCQFRNFNEESEYSEKPGWIYSKRWGVRCYYVGLVVYDSSNNEVLTINLPAGYTKWYDIDFFQMGDKRYLALEGVEDEKGEEYLLVYRLENNNSVSFVTAAPSSKVSPRNPKRGEKVSVTIDTPVGNGDAMVQVVSASGQTMLSKKIPAGQTQLDIDTSGFSQGMYVVTVSGNGVSKEAAKIIVR